MEDYFSCGPQISAKTILNCVLRGEMNSPIPPNNRGLLTAYPFGVGKIKNGLILQNIPCIFLCFDNVELNVINNVAARSKRKNNCFVLVFFFQYATPLIIQKSICILGESPQQRAGEQGGLPSFPYQCGAPAALGSRAFFSF